jgi:hypothetical protein
MREGTSEARRGEARQWKIRGKEMREGTSEARK